MTDSEPRFRTGSTDRIHRRTLLKLGVSIATAAVGVSPVAQAAGESEDTARETARSACGVRAGNGIATVEIETGRIAGYIRGGLCIFKGVPYGGDTGGQYRFLPPRKPDSWTGVRSSRQFGLISPQDKGTGRLNDEEAFMFQWNDSVEGEDCLRINIWTPGVNDNARRPVMVWLHGGGFSAGSGHDLPAFDGENLARRGDAVIVTLNHRLNLLGFLDLSAHGEAFAQSANAGLLDIVAALQWVRDNISVFGGDPGRVLVFGQSGGGGKVGALMAMPSARGLFHRAIVQSGSFSFTATSEHAQRLTSLIVAELGLGKNAIAGLQSLPYSTLQQATERVLRRHNPPPGGPPDVRRLEHRLGFGPVADGRVIPEAPFGDHGPAVSAEVPMIIGTTLNEFVTGINHPEYEQMTDAELLARTEASYPGRGAAIVSAFRRRSPGQKPFDLWSRIAAAPVRQAAIAQAAMKSAQGAAPAWLYCFAWQTPVLDGRPRAYHCADIPFVFNNTDLCDRMTGGGTDARSLGQMMADTWVQFARTGDPSHAGIVPWAPYSKQSGATLMVDDVTRVERHPDRDELTSLAEPDPGAAA
ncbi:MAG: carboxylesterase family protein [Woeseiaceae bacterium]